jgi:hypothetical protein
MPGSDPVQVQGSSFGLKDGQSGHHNEMKLKPWRKQMITKSLIAAAAVAVSLTALSPVQQAQAKTNFNFDIGVNLGGGGYYPGYGYGYGGGYPVYEPHYGGISCKKGRKIVDWSGFHNVQAYDCSAPVYQYRAWKNGNKYRVRVNMNGNIIGVKKI